MIQWKKLSNPPNQVYDFIIYQQNICRMCFKDADSTFKSVFDTLCIDSQYFTGSVTIDSLLRSFSSNQNDNCELPCQICKPCVNKLIQHFSFVQECKIKESYWQTAADKINYKLLEPYSKIKRNIYLDLNQPNNWYIVNHTVSFKQVKGTRGRPRKTPYLRTEPNELGKYICDMCSKEWPNEYKLIRHRESHFHDNLECEQCGTIFKNKKTITKHLKFNCKTKPECDYECKECTIIFKSQEAIEKHKKYSCKNLTPEELASNFCEWCSKTCKNRFTLREHRLICKKRDKTFMDAQVQFICNECGVSICSKKRLRHHIHNVHTTRNVPCDVCGKLFKSTTHVQNHMIVHTKEKPYQCEFCEKLFGTRNALAYHRRLHTGERPYPCSLCDQRFLSASRRMAHMRKKHLGRQFECEICHSKYFTNSSLKKHRGRHFNPNTKLERVFPNPDTKEWAYVDVE